MYVLAGIIFSSLRSLTFITRWSKYFTVIAFALTYSFRLERISLSDINRTFLRPSHGIPSYLMKYFLIHGETYKRISKISAWSTPGLPMLKDASWGSTRCMITTYFSWAACCACKDWKIENQPIRNTSPILPRDQCVLSCETPWYLAWETE